MSRIGPAALVTLALAVRWATLACALMLVLSVYAIVTGAAALADGPQVSPALQPERVEVATEPFSLVPPAGARCDEDGAGRSGADGWRWHTFIVEAGRDLSTLEFGPIGPGDDFDATDGQIAAALISGGRGVWAEPPAEQPRGMIDPGGLADLVLDPADYSLRDGRYLIGFACADDEGVTRQWWSLEVSVQVAGAPFLTARTDAGGPADSTTTSSTVAVGATDAMTSSTESTAPTEVAASETQDGAGGGSSETVASSPGDGAAAATGISWSPLVALVDASSVLPVAAWAGLVIVIGRISYLLARPLRVLPPLAP